MIVTTRSSFYKSLVFASTTLFNAPNINQVQNYNYAPAAQYVRDTVTQLIREEDPTLAGSILRLAFHDAAVRSVASNPNIGGSDGSIRYELEWSENRGLKRPLDIVNGIYQGQLDFCASTSDIVTIGNDKKCDDLSFADVLALSGAAAVEAANGPKITIKLGRTDVNSTSPNQKQYLDKPILSESKRSDITTSLPSAGLDSLGLRNFFVKRIGLSEAEMVALMGAHDLGRHVTLTDMPKSCLKNLTRTCLEEAPVLAPFITENPDSLSNSYYKSLLRWNDRVMDYGEAAFIPTDVAMVVDDGLKKYVVAFANNESLFFRTFVDAYRKLVETKGTSFSSRRY